MNPDNTDVRRMYRRTAPSSTAVFFTVAALATQIVSALNDREWIRLTVLSTAALMCFIQGRLIRRLGY